MMGLGWQELVIVLVIVVIVFGAGKLPEVGTALGRGVKEFKAQADDGQLDADVAGAAGRNGEGTVIAPRELRADQI